jgi:hypothetical protein
MAAKPVEAPDNDTHRTETHSAVGATLRPKPSAR